MGGISVRWVGFFCFVGAVSLACSGASSDPSPRGGDVGIPGVNIKSGGSNDDGEGGSGGQSGSTTAATTNASTSAGMVTFPDCQCLAARAMNATDCTNCCRSCYEGRKTNIDCQDIIDGCSMDPGGCAITVDLIEQCPADANFPKCLEAAMQDVTPPTDQLVAGVFDCLCGAGCQAPCGTSDTCP